MKEKSALPAIAIPHPYTPRPVRFLGIFETGGWRIKMHSISTRQEVVSNALVQQVKKELPAWFNTAAHTELETYKLAVLIIHEGREGVFVLLNWWIDEHMLQTHVYFSAYGEPYRFHYYSPTGSQVCVWEMGVLWFERNAWVKHILCKPEAPDVAAYLAETFNGEV